MNKHDGESQQAAGADMETSSMSSSNAVAGEQTDSSSVDCAIPSQSSAHETPGVPPKDSSDTSTTDIPGEPRQGPPLPSQDNGAGIASESGTNGVDTEGSANAEGQNDSGSTGDNSTKSINDEKLHYKDEEGGKKQSPKHKIKEFDLECTQTGMKFGQQANIIRNIIMGRDHKESVAQEDPTSDFPDLGPFNPREGWGIDAQAKRLTDERMLVVTATEEDDRVAAVKCLFDHQIFAGKVKRLLKGNYTAGAGQQLGLESLVKLPIASGQPALVLVMVEEDGLAALIPRNSVFQAAFREELKHKDLLIVIAVKTTGPPSPGWWDATPPLASDATDVAASHSKFAKLTKGEAPGEALLRTTALYVATYFDRLSTGDFNAVMRILLDGKTIDAPPANPDKPRAKLFSDRQQTAPLAAATAWREQGDAILEKLEIGLLPELNGRQSFSFVNGAARRSAQEYLEKSQVLFCDEQVERLLRSDVVLSKELSDTVTERILVLLKTLLQSDPERGTKALHGLLDFALATGEPLGAPASSAFRQFHEELGETFDQMANALQYLFRRKLRGEYKDRIKARVARWFSVLEGDPATQKPAWAFIEKLKNSTSCHDICELFIISVEDRRYQPSSLFWKKLLYWYDVSNDNSLRDKIYVIITRYSARDDSSFFDLLGHLVDWLPKKPEERPSPSGVAALTIVYNYLMFSDKVSERNDAAQWPPLMPLLSGMGGDTPEAQQYRCNLVRWLFHPAWRTVDIPWLIPVENRAAEPESRMQHNRKMMAVLFLSCVMEALATRSKAPVHPNSQELATSLIKLAYDELGRSQQAWFQDILTYFRAQLLELRADFSNGPLPRRKAQLADIDNLRHALARVSETWSLVRFQATNMSDKRSGAATWFSS